jgi:hypothetical protein
MSPWVEPSARYQEEAGAVTPTESCPPAPSPP